MSVDAMTELRRALRGRGVDFRVVKNRLSYLAADAAGKPILKEIITGPTGLALGVGDPVEPPKALSDFIANTRYPLKLRGGLLADRVLSDEDLGNMAKLSSKDELIDFSIRTGAPLEVVENLQTLEDEGDIYESVIEIWPDYPTDDDYLWNEDEY